MEFPQKIESWLTGHSGLCVKVTENQKAATTLEEKVKHVTVHTRKGSKLYCKIEIIEEI